MFPEAYISLKMAVLYGGGQKENTMGDKHYVYSSRTTKEGLALFNKSKGDKSWDQFINDAISAHYGLDPPTVNLPPSRFLAEREEKRKVREAEKAKKAAGKKAKAKVEKPAKKAAKQTAEPRPA
jgi:hypothetical protein